MKASAQSAPLAVPGSSSKVTLGPLCLRPVLQPRVWGVTSLPVWCRALQSGSVPESPIGEAWLTAEECVVVSGPHAGQTLAELVRAHPAAFADDAGQGFSLLLKLLFPREKLSVQVHPDDLQAQALGQPRGKTECWYIVAAEPGATVAVGFREELSPEALRRVLADGTVEEHLRLLPVHAGDLVYVDAGTVHAIGPGIVILETQQYSDITYRLYDYGRPRELHLEAGLAVLRHSPQAGLVTPVPMSGFTRLVESPYFVVDRFCADPASTSAVELPLHGSHPLQLLVPLGEGATLLREDAAALELAAACAAVLPAEGESYRLSLTPGVEVLRITTPDRGV